MEYFIGVEIEKISKKMYALVILNKYFLSSLQRQSHIICQLFTFVLFFLIEVIPLC